MTQSEKRDTPVLQNYELLSNRIFTSSVIKNLQTLDKRKIHSACGTTTGKLSN